MNVCAFVFQKIRRERDHVISAGCLEMYFNLLNAIYGK